MSPGRPSVAKAAQSWARTTSVRRRSRYAAGIQLMLPASHIPVRLDLIEHQQHRLAGCLCQTRGQRFQAQLWRRRQAATCRRISQVDGRSQGPHPLNRGLGKFSSPASGHQGIVQGALPAHGRRLPGERSSAAKGRHRPAAAWPAWQPAQGRGPGSTSCPRVWGRTWPLAGLTRRPTRLDSCWRVPAGAARCRQKPIVVITAIVAFMTSNGNASPSQARGRVDGGGWIPRSI
jgi:hypothetical protein